MRIDGNTIYAPDLLAYPIGYTGDPVINGITGGKTLSTLNDAYFSGDAGTQAAAQMASTYAGSPTSPTGTTTVDPCDRWKGTWQYYLCKGTDIGTGGIGGDIYNKGQDAASAVSDVGSNVVTRAGLFLLALVVLAIGLWAIVK